MYIWPCKKHDMIKMLKAMSRKGRSININRMSITMKGIRIYNRDDNQFQTNNLYRVVENSIEQYYAAHIDQTFLTQT